MNRGEIVKAIAEDQDLPATTVDQVLGGFFAMTIDVLVDGDQVGIRGFGKFEPRKRRAVVRRNPATGIEMRVPALRTVGFLPSARLKSRLNETGRKNGRRAVRS